MTFRSHAMQEFKAAGWLYDNGKFKDYDQSLICNQVLELLDVLSNHNHSGSSHSYAVGLFTKLAKFEPISPLTGEDWEWIEITEPTDLSNNRKYQNKRCPHVFKDDTGSYDIDGKIFYEWYERELSEDEEGYPGKELYKHFFTSRDSRVYITFPYTPSKEYIEVTR